MNKTIVQIKSELEMAGFIKGNGSACRFVAMLTDTKVKNIKASSPYKGVRKVSRKFGLINVNFTESVKRKIAAKLGVETSQVEYEAGDVWYKHVETVDGKRLPLVENKNKKDGKLYLQYFPTRSENAYIMPDGTRVSEEQIKPWFYADNRPDFKPAVISIGLENIKELRASGVIMQAEDLEVAEAALNG